MILHVILEHGMEPVVHCGPVGRSLGECCELLMVDLDDWATKTATSQTLLCDRRYVWANALFVGRAVYDSYDTIHYRYDVCGCMYVTRRHVTRDAR
jgi:hypothetical protein